MPIATVPDYMLDQNAVLRDNVAWRHGSVPDYSMANAAFETEASKRHKPGSMEDMISNLIKNWEKEASYKLKAGEWRTIDHAQYTFSCNGGPVYSCEDMMRLGTYSALIGESAFFSSSSTTFEDSHRTFREAMPGGFAWEAVEVYSGPPVASFKWRHWGRMTGKLRCPVGPSTFVDAPPHGGMVELWGVGIAHINPKYQITKIEIYYDPHELMGNMVGARNLCPVPHKESSSFASPPHNNAVRNSMDAMRRTSTDSMNRFNRLNLNRGDSLLSDLDDDW
ncbi:hypothetical protein ABBQ32_001792 [Trebouxia sp. C0010 RCD-2024]